MKSRFQKQPHPSTKRPQPPLRLADVVVIVHMAKAGDTKKIAAASKRLKRMLLNAERTHRREIMMRVGRGPGAVYLVTLPAVRLWCPYLFDTGAELPQAIRDAFADQQEQIDYLQKRTATHGAAIRRISSLLTEIATE